MFVLATSTPNTSPRLKIEVTGDSDLSIIDRPPSPPLLISDPSISEAEESHLTSTLIECDCRRPRSLAEVTEFSRVRKTMKFASEKEEPKSIQEEHEVANTLKCPRKEKPVSGNTCVSKNQLWRVEDSIRACSVDSGSAASDATRIQSLENKLLATMQILKNKEETVRVQAESLALAEERIAALSSKAQTVRLHQAQQTNLFNTRSSCDGNHVETTDVSSTAQMQEKRIVKTLRDNLSVIEELYRECFYETAKQEELISILRRSYLDMRLEKKQSEQFGVHLQRNSFEKCQDIAMEVEHLKTEITNFLNSSTNNDSGVWEREEVSSELTEDLRGIADQLHRLRDILNGDCTCGLEEENMKLKRRNETLEIHIGELRQRISDLDDALADKENMDQSYQLQITEKEHQLQLIRQQLLAVEEGSRDQSNACDTLTLQLKQIEVLLSDKTTELVNTQQQCESQERIIRELREEIQKADLVERENNQIRSEVSQLSSQVSEWREQLADSRRRLRTLEDELERAREHCRHLAIHYREKAQTARDLQNQLSEARYRGATLCSEAQRAVCSVRRWLKAQRDKQKQQEEKIREQELIIQSLQTHQITELSENEPCCSKYLVEARQHDTSRTCASEKNIQYTHETRKRANETASQYRQRRGSSSARASEKPCSKCSRVSETDSSTPPVPPKRLLRKKICGDRRCQWPPTRDASVQRPLRSDTGVDTRISREHILIYSDTPSREVSPPDELLERVERAHEALAEAQRRWSRHSNYLGEFHRDT